MSEPFLLARCDDAEALVRAARAAREKRLPATDALSPHPVPELDEALALPASAVRPVMLVGGLVSAAAMFLLQTWYSTQRYPLNSGGRPTFGWPSFLVPTFETGILGAAAAGFIALLIACRLPRLRHPLFESDAVARVSSDAFLLVFAAAGAEAAREVAALPGVREVTEVRP